MVRGNKLFIYLLQCSKSNITMIDKFIITEGSKLFHRNVIRYIQKRGFIHNLINCYFIWDVVCSINLQCFCVQQSRLGEIRCNRGIWSWRFHGRSEFQQVEKIGKSSDKAETGRSLSMKTAVGVQGSMTVGSQPSYTLISTKIFIFLSFKKNSTFLNV